MWLAVFLVGLAMFVASLVMEKKPAAGAPVVGSTLIDSLRLGGVILVTLGLVAMLILNAASGGFLGDVSGNTSAF